MQHEQSALMKPPQDEESAGVKSEADKLALVAREILEELEKQKEFERLKKNVKLQMTSEGLRIILNESEDAPAFFEPGSAKLLQKSAIILITIARELGKLENHVVIEGHTDRSGSNDGEYSNWELSADRANAARQLMEVSGLYGGQVREVRGYADRFPMIENQPQDARNRRVSLIVLYQAREKMYDQIEVGEDLMSQI
jgi:chemotaxis protein MotB